MAFRTRDLASLRSSRVARILPLTRSRAQTRIERAAGNALAAARFMTESLEERVLFATFTVTNTGNSGGGSFRQAIIDANNRLGADLIVFNIVGSPVVISPSTPLPTITDPVAIDGTSQPGYDANNPVPVIRLDGRGSGDGFHITGGNTSIRGFTITNFGIGIRADTVGGNSIVGNYIGTDASGTTSEGNDGDGIQLNVGDNFVGLYFTTNQQGNTVAVRDATTVNVISGNGDDGIDLNSGGNTVQNNFIGTDIAGTGMIGNGDNGIEIDFSGSTSGNLIGDSYDPNGDPAEFNRRNTIAFNHGVGVDVLHGVNNSILGNVITENGDLGIDLGDDGIDGVDTGDLDTGPNDRLNRPILSGAPTVINITQVNGFLNTLPDRTFRVEFYTDFDPDESAGEGQIFISSVDVTTDDDGRATIAQQLPIFIPAGRSISATATLLDGTGFPTSTSEFALNVLAGTSPGIGIKGNGQNITIDGASDPANGTDFQSQDVDAGPKTKTFVIRNTGSSTLHLNGLTDRVTIDDPSGAFTILSQPDQGSLAPGQETSFTVAFDPSVVGTEATAEVSVVSDDPDESPFNFEVTGIGTLKLVSINSATTAEGNSGLHNLDFTVDLSSSSPNDITVPYVIAGGTATLGTDFQAGPGFVTIPAGSLSGVISIPIVGDTSFENDETFTVTLQPVSGVVGVSTATATGTITNDDAAPTAIISDVTVTEGQSGITPATFTVTLSQVSLLPVTLNYATANGTATAGEDFDSATGVVTVPAGETSATFTVNVLGDRTVEPNENFLVNLSGAAGATIVDAQAVGTIINDDRTFTFSGGGLVTEAAGGSVATFTISLDQPSTEEIKVNYGTLNGTATAPADYTPVGGTLTFAPGETSKTVTVPVAPDTLAEGNETFSLGLSSPVNAGVTTTSLTATIRDSLQPFLAFDGRSPITYVDASGDNVTISMRGPGQAHLLFSTTAGTGDPTGLVIDGTTAASVVAIDASGAGTTLGAISVNRSIKQIAGGNVDLTGNAQFRGTLRQLQLRDLKGSDSTINIAALGTVYQMAFNSVSDFNITGNSKIRTLSIVGGWLDTMPGVDTINVPAIQTLNCGGDFEADIRTGTLYNASFKGALRASDMFVSVGIRSLFAGSITDSLIYVGVNDGFTGDLPRADTDYSNDAAYIRQLKTNLFSNSKIAAPLQGTIALGRIQTANNQVLFGVSVDKIKTFTGTSSRGEISFANLDAPQSHPEDDFLLLVYKDNTPVQRRA